MILSKATGYGIRALVYLAQQNQGRPCGLREIADAEVIPSVYLRKILGELRRHRILKSSKGIHGGYELFRTPEQITLWEVFQILDPNPEFVECPYCQSTSLHNGRCPLHEDWNRIRAEFFELLKNKTIAQMKKGDQETRLKAEL